MYKALVSFTMNKNVYEEVDVKKGEILAEDFASQEIIEELLDIGHIVEYDGSLEITENGTYNVKDYDSADVNVSSGADISEYFNTNIATPNDFHKNNIKKIPALTIVDGVNTLRDYFFNWVALEEIENISGGADVTSYEGFLNNCKKLENIKFNNLNTSKVVTMYSMFNRCEKLTSLDLSSFTSESLTTTSYMFIGCKTLMYIDMRNMTFDNVTSYTGMFYTTSSDGVPANCEIIVKSQTEKEWITSNFSRLTNVKTVAEL